MIIQTDSKGLNGEQNQKLGIWISLIKKPPRVSINRSLFNIAWAFREENVTFAYTRGLEISATFLTRALSPFFLFLFYASIFTRVQGTWKSRRASRLTAAKEFPLKFSSHWRRWWSRMLGKRTLRWRSRNFFGARLKSAREFFCQSAASNVRCL